MVETKVDDIVYVEKSDAFCGIMEGNEYKVTSVVDDFITINNGVFFSSLNWSYGDRWKVVNDLSV